jgi:two-component system cell cycle response regulator DivK
MATILLVEDNLDNRTIYRVLLEHFGYQVHEAHNGQEALDQARAVLPDLILMDISIPIIDGYEATRILKGDPATRAIPIIALTAHALKTDQERVAATGFDGYLAKPVEPKRVVEEVRRHLDGGSAAGPTA